MGEADLKAEVLPPDIEAVGVAEDCRIAVGAGERERHEVAGRDRDPAELGVTSRISVDHGSGGLEPQRLFHGCVDKRRGSAQQQFLVGILENVQERVGDHRLCRLDPAEEQHRSIRGHLLARQPSCITCC